MLKSGTDEVSSMAVHQTNPNRTDKTMEINKFNRIKTILLQNMELYSKTD